MAVIDVPDLASQVRLIQTARALTSQKSDPGSSREAAAGELRSRLMSARARSPGVLYVIVCGAPAAASVDEFVRLALDAGWLVRVIATADGRTGAIEVPGQAG